MNLFKNNQSANTTEVNALIKSICSSADSLAKGKYDLQNAIKRALELNESIIITAAAEKMQESNDLSTTKKNDFKSTTEYLTFLESKGNEKLELWAQGSYKTNAKVEIKASKALEHMNKGYSGALDGKCRFPANLRALRENLIKLTTAKTEEKTTYTDLIIDADSLGFELKTIVKPVSQKAPKSDSNKADSVGTDNPQETTAKTTDSSYKPVEQNALKLDTENKRRLIRALVQDDTFMSEIVKQASLAKLDLSSVTTTKGKKTA